MTNTSIPPNPPLSGKSVACMNHLKHGAASETLFLKDENPSDFFALLENAFEQYQPAFDQDAILVTRCVRANWILTRRERVTDAFASNLNTRKPDPTYWVTADLDEMHLFDRYQTTAARAYSRCLKDLQTIRKIANDDQRWQLQLESQKQKLAIDVDRWNLLKQKEQAKATPPPPLQEEEYEEPAFHLPNPLQTVGIEQTLYIGIDYGATVIFEITPSNDQLRASISETDQILRTYNFVGAVPSEYQHLITADAITWGKSTCVQKLYSHQEWSALTKAE